MKVFLRDSFRYESSPIDFQTVSVTVPKARRVSLPQRPPAAGRVRVPAGSRKSLLGRISLNRNDHSVHIGTSRIRLTPKQFALLRTLARKPGRVYARTELLTEVWGKEGRISVRTVDAHMMMLRKKLARSRKSVCQIQTVWCIGYKLKLRKHPK